MPVAIAALAFLAAALAVALVLVQRAARRDRADAQAQLGALRRELSEVRATGERHREELNGARSEVSALEDRVRSATAQESKLENELQLARTRAAAARTKVSERDARIEALEAERADLASRLGAAESAASAGGRNETDVVIGEAVDLDGPRDDALWQLEIARSERTWRQNVAPNPEAGGSPFEECDDPVRLAVEIEAAALRESVGAHISVDWQAAPVEPARRHLILRVAQEMLEAAARNPEPARLVVLGGGEVTMHLEATDGDELGRLVPPRVTSRLIEAREESGLSLTVRTE
ncbi:MAG: hypothetical protein S0880_16860 [Actinomycetota bacterium]|nr:hypothetical protein [Actinomycetota bacterium]